jgi:CRISPR type IV-associated protein Csf3
MQIPLPIEVTAAYTCDLVGDGGIIADLLTGLSHIGKKRTQGHGDILDWQLQRIDNFALTDEEGALRRTLPCAALKSDGGQLFSWTPPYWHPACHALCLPTGTMGVETQL